jgi:hypothetical protein
MAKRSNVIRFPAPRTPSVNVHIPRQRAPAKPKRKHHRRRGAGASAGIETMLKGAIATKVASPIVLGMLPGGMRLMNDDVTIAVIAHYAHADKHVKGVQLWTKFKAIDSVLSAGGLLDIFHKS